MKRFALNLILGVALAAGSNVAGAVIRDPTIVNNSTTTSSGKLDGGCTVRNGFHDLLRDAGYDHQSTDQE